MKNVEMYIKEKLRRKAVGRRAIVLVCALSLLLSSGIFWELHEIGLAETVTTVYCGLEEHTHGEACTEKALICGMGEAHTHSDACYAEQQTLNCAEEHEHTSACFTTEQALVCSLPETEHVHSEACYAEQQTLNCAEEHEHTEACFTTEQTLVCSLPENGHVHSEACYETTLVCNLEEHWHSETCYAAPAAYTVDFHYNGSTYSMPGRSSILLSSLLEALGYTEHTAAEANAVTFSNETLLQVQPLEKDWLLTSLAPFDTREALSIFFANGTQLVLDVTDEADLSVQNTNDEVYLGKSDDGTMKKYQVLGKLYPSVKCYYYEWGGFQKVTINLYNANGGLMGSGKMSNVTAAVALSMDSADYWFKLNKWKNMVEPSYKTGLQHAISFGGVSGINSYIDVIAYSRITYNNSNYCRVTQQSVFSKTTQTRTVKVYADGVYVGEWSGLFPSRSGMSASDLTVSSLAAPYYKSATSVENGYYRVDLYSRYTVTGTVDGERGTANPTSQYVDMGKSGTISFTASTGYLIDYITDNGVKVDVPNAGTYNYTVSNVTAARNIVAYTTPKIYTVTWVNYDGTVLQEGSITHGSTPVYTGATPSRPNANGNRYTFSGWSPAVTAATQSVTYTAQYTQERLTYNVVYDANGGSNAPAAQSKIHGTALTLSSAVPVRTSYTFSGWNTAANGSGTAYASGASYTADANVTLYAQWVENTVTITYEAELGGTVNRRSEAVGVVTGTIQGATATANTGYTFAGWYDASGNPVSGNASFKPTSKTAATYTAKFTENTVTITYKAETNGTVSLGSETVGVVTGTLQGSTATANTGYTFAGWYDASGTLVSGNASFKPTSKTAATYTARFTENTVTITYKAETGGTVSPETETVGVVTGTVQGSTATANSGYIFDGWYNAAGEKVSNEATYRPDKATATYTARFKENAFTIHYVAQGEGGSVAPTQETVGIGAAINGSSATALTGYRFSGWYVLNGDEYIKVADTSKLVPTERRNSTYYALFEPDYTVTKELSYTVRHIADGVCRDTETVTETVWLHAPATTLDIRNISLKAYPGYQYDSNNAELTLNGSVLTGSGAIADGGVIEVNYTAVESTVKVTMTVNGKLADKTLPFTGSVNWSCSDSSSDSLPFRLADGADVSSAVIKAGEKLSVSLDSADSTYQLVRVTVNGVEYTDAGSLSDLPFVAGENTVAIVYERPDGPPGTGIDTGSLTPMLALLAMAAACGGALLVSKKRRDAEG